MSNNEKIYKNLNLLLRMFKNRPYHLAKYLLDNKALTNDFLKKIESSEKLNELSGEDQKLLPVFIKDISKMEEFFSSLIEPSQNQKSVEELTKELNQKLNECIKSEQFEDAARIRDYMSRHGIKRTNN